MKLFIVESPAKAKTVNKYLGSDFKVLASIGHIRDLPKSNKKAIDIEGGFLPHYEISKGKEKVVEEIKKEAKKSKEIILATDPDREGEAIAWHIAEEIKKLKLKNIKIKRATYNEITKEAVEESLNNLREIDQNLRKAQEARRVLDRLVGYDLSGLIWKKVRYGLSAGRVQSPALRILMEKEREIRAFKSEMFFVILAEIETPEKEKFTLVCAEEIKDREKAGKILTEAKISNWIVESVEELEAKRSPRPPFTTSTLQQVASSRLGFSPKRTMMAAQKLYEAGSITYMRTDSLNISKTALEEARKIVTKKFGQDMHQTRVYKNKSKNAEEAHEAIRPTHLEKEIAGNSDDQKKIYGLIWQRTVSSQMKDAKILRTKVAVELKDKKTNNSLGLPNFVANGSRILEEGWLKCDFRAKGEDVLLPKVKSSEELKLIDIKSEEKQTEPPNRYSEAGLIKELEKRGIGRPSTYASIISTIIERGYVEKIGKALKPTDTGDVVSSFLENNFENYISDTFTAEMENELDEIAEGKRGYKETLEEFYKPFKKDVKEKEKSAKLTNLGEADPKIKCPICDSSMIVKLGKNGKFLSCDKFPECKGMRNLDGSEIKEASSLGIDPETGLSVFVMNGRFGPYVQLGDSTSLKSERGSTKGSRKGKPKRSSLPKDKNPDEVTLEDALKYLSLPRELGQHPDTGEMISANIGRFGPYIVHQKDFRSLKTDDVYKITLDRAIEILKEPKKFGRGRFNKKK